MGEHGQTYHIQATITPEGGLRLDDLPFKAGESVDVTITPEYGRDTREACYSLRGMPVRLSDPFAPVDPDAWSAAS
jgi:hypothetical protein